MSSGYQRPICTSRDIQILVGRFSIEELRQELRAADIHISVARQFGEDAEEAYFTDYTNAIELAIEIKRAIKQADKPQPQIGKVHVEAVKAQAHIVDIVNQHVELRKSGNRYLGLCPFHTERPPSLTVYPEKQRWHCFGCSKGGDVISFVMTIENINFKQAVALLGGK